MDIYAGNVESSNDILTEILVRLPQKSVFKFTCVSKRWNNLIMDPSFIRSYSERRKGILSGFIQSTFRYLCSRRNFRRPWEPTHNFLSITGDTSGHNDCFPGKLGYFICSSDGLLLCGRHPMTYHVVNPITKRWVSLPSPPKHYRDVSVGLFCEESNDLVVRYKVVRACTPRGAFGTTLPIETYSSVTGEWRESTLIAPCVFSIGPFYPPTVIKGVFHWFASRRRVAVYDSNEHGGENHLQLIELPFDILTESNALGRSDDGCLWYGESNPENMKIWVLPKGAITKEDWILVHLVSSDTLRKGNPIIENGWRENHACDGQVRYTKPLRKRRCVIFVTFIPWDPLDVLLRDGDNIWLYHLKSNLMESVRFHGRPHTNYDNWHPYFESVSLSSYALNCNSSMCGT